MTLFVTVGPAVALAVVAGYFGMRRRRRRTRAAQPSADGPEK